MSLLKVTPYGDPLLRRQSAKIKEIDDEVLTLISDMTETMHAANGVGLAAPQVGHSKMLFLSDWSAMGEEGNSDKGIIAYINPEILESSSSQISKDEGCLSLPGVWAEVQRPDKITVRYMNVKGETIEEELVGYPARVFQHELDHLMGILFIDRISISLRAEWKSQLQGIMDGSIKPFDGTLPTDKEIETPKSA